jgi:K+-transporting ATPase KdpF subunit
MFIGQSVVSRQPLARRVELLNEFLTQNIWGSPMILIVITTVVTAFLFIYLLVALLRPEWF